jgi:hypothetical protein
LIGQVGHADSKMTMDVYAQLQQRVKREHGRAFDRLVRQAREQLYGTASGLPEAMPEPNLGHESGHEDRLRANRAARENRAAGDESADLQDDPGVARPGLEPGTPRFSVVRSPTPNVRNWLQTRDSGEVMRQPQNVANSGCFFPIRGVTDASTPKLSTRSQPLPTHHAGGRPGFNRRERFTFDRPRQPSAGRGRR